MSNWVVYVSADNAAHAYVAFDNSADDLAHKPFDQATAEGLASNINAFSNVGAPHTAVALPAEECTQPGV